MRNQYSIGELEKFLSDFGLTPKQSGIYLASLQLGPASIQDIAHAAKMQRTNIYDAAEELVAKGLMSITATGKRRLFVAENPSALKSILHEKERALNETLPQLKTLHSASEVKPRIRFYPGLEGYKQVYEDTLTTNEKKLYGIFSVQDVLEVLGRPYAEDMFERRAKKGIALRVIRSKVRESGPVYPSSLGDLRELRFAPPNFDFPITTYVYDNKVMILSSKRETFGLIIESQDIATTHRQYFDALWQISTPDRPGFHLSQFDE
jgi:HTH-type transcriptional regulator, sugar sensing transcriptional regulator